MTTIDIEKIQIEPYDGKRNLSNFTCGHTDLDEFLKEDSIQQKEIMLNSTYLIIYDDNIIGFFTLSTDKIKLNNLENEYKQHFKDKNITYKEFPAIKLGRLGILEKLKGNGIGTFLINWIIYYSIGMSKNIGFRFITIDAYLGKPYEFYKKNHCKNIYNPEKLKKEINKYEKLKERNHPDAYKRTVPMFIDLYKFKDYL